MPGDYTMGEFAAQDQPAWQAPPTALERWPVDPSQMTANEAAAFQTQSRYRNALARDPESNKLGALAEMIAPQTPLDYALYASGPLRALPVAGRAAAYGVSAAMDPSEAQAGITRLIKPLVTKFDPNMLEGSLSAIKQRIPLSDLEQGRKFTQDLPQVARSRPEDLTLGGNILSLHGDRSDLGRLHEMLGKGVKGEHDIHGGVGFIEKQSPSGAVWASEPSVSSAYQNKINWLQGVYGTPVYGSYGPMGVRSIDFQPAVSKLVLEQVKGVRGKLDASDVEAFDKDMRRQWGGPTKDNPGKKADWPAVPEWPGVTKTAKAIDFLENAPGGIRNKFVKLMDKGDVMDAGFPNVSAIRHALTNPDVANIPNYSYGKGMAKLSSEPVGGFEHPAFGKNIAGESMGGFGYATPREVSFMDVVGDLKAQKEPVKSWDYYFGGRMPKTVPYHQPVTQRWIDANSAFGEQAAKMGELAAFDKFSREGLRF